MHIKTDFSRQEFLGNNSEATISKVRVLIAGLGGGGSHIAQQLAHVGVKHFRLIDPQAIEQSNLNRLVTATQKDVDDKQFKVEILRKAILAIRPDAEVIAHTREWQRADRLLKDAHVGFGCLDGYRNRDYLERATRRFGIPYIDIGMDVVPIAGKRFAVSGQMIVSKPGCPCMRCMGFITDDRLQKEDRNYANAGVNPQVVWVNGVLASLAVGAFMQLLTPWSDNHIDYQWLEYDGNDQTVRSSEQPKYLIKGRCTHFDGKDDLGDPKFHLENSASGIPYSTSNPIGAV